ncbi:hypothetical protein ACQUFY_26410 (plasmid) [Robbsia andropogonis]|uniref:hypothetical protein n=1 Tax=Robbsia andropogonis TaxID=28092 RepID=UPI003D251EE5
MSDLSQEKANALGGQNLMYYATTARGKRYKCKAFMIPGLLPGDAPSYSDLHCEQR